MNKKSISTNYNNERGVSAVLIAILMFVLLFFGALALDISHLVVAKNELQNAADAGALAGARFLYDDDGAAVNPNANQIAFNAAVANKSERVSVEHLYHGVVYASEGDTYPVQQPGDDWVDDEDVDVDILRGHWSFATKNFTPSDSLNAVALWGVTDEQLDAMDGSDGNDPFINAVQVVARRTIRAGGTPIASFFARILGYENFQRKAKAVAYIGFAGSIAEGVADQPIAICEDSILCEDEEGNKSYCCNIGRMINSGQQVESSETGGWTSFEQGEEVCSGGTNAPTVRNLVCGTGNPDQIREDWLATNGGEIQSAFSDLLDCWKSQADSSDPPDGIPDELWNMTLPVVSCPSNNVGTCEWVEGAVNLNVIWITEAGEDPSYNNAPDHMAGWEFTGEDVNGDGITDGQDRWAEFASVFNLQNVDGTPAPYAKKSIYFLPDCTPHSPTGVTGGDNFGVLAEIPVLVR